MSLHSTEPQQSQSLHPLSPQRNEHPRIVWLDPVESVTLPDVGGKGASLFALSRVHGIRIPEGFVLCTRAYEETLSSNHLIERVATLDRLIDKLHDPRQRTSTTELKQQIEFNRESLHTALLNCTITTDYHESLSWAARILRKFVGDTEPIILRSSATAEDDTYRSAAGQYHSESGLVTLKDLVPGIKRVWASVFSPEALSYHIALRGEHQPAAPTLSESGIAVVVQRAIPASASGVAFSGDARDGRPGIAIEAVPGLGERFFAGEVSADHWLLEAESNDLLEHTVVGKSSKLVIAPSGGVISKPLPGEQRLAASLTPSQIVQVASALKTVRNSSVLGDNHIDLEFAFDSQGELYTVQVRPQSVNPPQDQLNPVVFGVAPNTTRQGKSFALLGESASLGAAVGRLVVIPSTADTSPEGDTLALAQKRLRTGDILVTSTTNIGWTPLFERLAGLVVERGGVMSHSAIIARERGIPAIVNAHGATRALAQLRTAQSLEGGKVLVFPKSTLDTINGRLDFEALPIVARPLIEVIDPAAQESTALKRDHRKDFAQFVDGNGREWVGRPDYQMSPLQFDLHYRAWRHLYELLRIEQCDLPLGTSQVTPYSEGRRDGKVGVINSELTEANGPHQYQVVAFESGTLTNYCEKVRTRGLVNSPFESAGDLFEQLNAFERSRAAAFNQLLTQSQTLEDVSRPTADAIQRLFEAYVEATAHSHFLSLLRRQVVEVSRVEALERVPKELRQNCQRLFLRYSAGLITETTHRRDPAYQVLLDQIRQRPSLQAELTHRPATEALDHLANGAPDLHAQVLKYLRLYKLQRYQPSLLDGALPIARFIAQVQSDLESGPPSLENLTYHAQTPKGLSAQLERLRSSIMAADPDFDFDYFKKALVYAWQFPATVDELRHIQHRVHCSMQRCLLGIEATLHSTGALGLSESVFAMDSSTLLANLS